MTERLTPDAGGEATAPDAALLDAFEKVRAHRAYAYSFDDLSIEGDLDEATRKELEAGDAEMMAHEATVHSTNAVTIGGVLARLQLAIPTIDQNRWIDRTLMQHGLLTLHTHLDGLSGDAQQVTSAAFDLLRIDWDQALTAYERSSADYTTLLDLKAFAENEMFARQRAGEPAEFAEAIHKMIDDTAGRVMDQDCANLDRLIETPVPDWDAYRRKAEIAIKELVADKVAPWLLRDANALLAAQEGEA